MPRNVCDALKPPIEGALEAQGTEIRVGDAVLIRTGYMQPWGVDEEQTNTLGFGVAYGIG